MPSSVSGKAVCVESMVWRVGAPESKCREESPRQRDGAQMTQHPEKQRPRASASWKNDAKDCEVPICCGFVLQLCNFFRIIVLNGRVTLQ